MSKYSKTTTLDAGMAGEEPLSIIVERDEVTKTVTVSVPSDWKVVVAPCPSFSAKMFDAEIEKRNNETYEK